jgi:hypothetical protein
MPRLRIAGDSDENGRGLRVVSQLAQRWGTRRTPEGKAVWFELTLPEGRAAGGTVGPGQDMPAG